jgi:putative secretion ATPase (PEP-CTERM system associated)
MYELYYNLTAEPFRLSPDHRFCYEHKSYAKARAYITYAFLRAEGFVMVTGRPGTGKTTLVGELLEYLAGENCTTAYLTSTQLQANDLLKMVAYRFGVGNQASDKAALLQALDFQLTKWNHQGRRAVLIVDEAQGLPQSAMEELRLLTNIQIDGRPLLQIFLLGQPELRDLILSPEMEQLHQRIVAAARLEALTESEVGPYILHRLERVGWQGDPALSKSIFPLIHRFSEGVPRRVNLICSRLLLHGSVEQSHRIGMADIREVISELQNEELAVSNLFSELDFAVDDVFDEEPPTESAEEPGEACEEQRLREPAEAAADAGEAAAAPEDDQSSRGEAGVSVLERGSSGGQEAGEDEPGDVAGQSAGAQLHVVEADAEGTEPAHNADHKIPKAEKKTLN